ncbi:MAG: hypothetical protein IT365_20055 [Candidatus Hydrogenedentes bacterium]|nr:hypothetical protein [Candidatus Hydrogenedentota bacterium]
MNNPRIDIGKRQWIALRDGLFIHVRTRRHWCVDISVVPRERVRLIARSALPLLRTIPFISYAALFGAPAFAICVVVALGVYRESPGFGLAMAILWTLPLTVLLAVCMQLFGRIIGRRETVLYTCSSVHYPVIRIRHKEGTNPALEAFLDTLPTGTDTPATQGPLSEMYRLPSPRRSAVGLIYLAVWLSMAWSSGYQVSNHADIDSLNLWCFGVLAALYTFASGAQLLFYLCIPRTAKEARAALFDGDYEAAALILGRQLEETPGHPYASFLRMAVALMQGDLEGAATCAEVVKKSRIMRYLWPPLLGVIELTPHAENLRALAAHLSAAGHAQPSEDLLPPISPIAPIR